MGMNVCKRVIDSALLCGLALCASLLAPPFRAQTTTSAVRIVTAPDPVWFYVDGTAYRFAAAFSWPTGSKHTISTDAIQDRLVGGTRYTFAGWSAGSNPLPGNTITVTADPSIAEYKATFVTEVALRLSFFDCDPESSLPCDSPGTVYVAGAPFKSSTVVWVAKGGVVRSRAARWSGSPKAAWFPFRPFPIPVTSSTAGR
jgi:hypothetical protein